MFPRQLTLMDLAEGLRAERFTSVDLIQALLKRIEAHAHLRYFTHLNSRAALCAAEQSDKRRQEGKSLGLLDGIPIGIKDAIAVAKEPLSCGSAILEGYVSPYDATVVRKLKEKGAIAFGRLNLDEFCMGSTTEFSCFGRSDNPWKKGYSTGGSSGGSAGAVATCLVPAALGSDTGGSIRQPAAWCGTFGLRTTYGLVSRYGLMGFAPSMDQIGPLARTPEDLAAVLEAIVGHDRFDAQSLRTDKVDYVKATRTKCGPLTLGLVREYTQQLNGDIADSLEQVVEHYRKSGHTVREISLPTSFLAIAVYHVQATCEAASNLARFDAINYGKRAEGVSDLGSLYRESREAGFGSEVKRRIILGTWMLTSGYHHNYYGKARKARDYIRADFQRAFESCDVLLGATLSSLPFPAYAHKQHPIENYLTDSYLINASLAGLPTLHVPTHLGKKGWPCGFQLIGKPLEEATLLSLAAAFPATLGRSSFPPVDN